MSSEPAISVRCLGKAYRIQSLLTHGTLVEAGMAHLRQMLRRDQLEQVWALKDVSFDVQPGEVVGLLGHNGAGKSTLLKLLSRITPPTTGEAIIRGRSGSLLEVGTGFHRELTGRENIYLNGGILGMNRGEIDRHFDAIVDFSGVEKYLDTPVKRYSSGMFVRLAFAVAAHLRTEVLIVDEVLAVGDAQFQKKCLGKMEDAAKSGRTVLLVSHNMATIQSLCPRSILLRHGEMVMDGQTEDVINAYLEDLSATGSADTDADSRVGTGEARVTGVRLLDHHGDATTTLVGGEDVAIELEYHNPGNLRHPTLLGNIYNDRGHQVTTISTDLTNPDLGELQSSGRLVCRLPRLPLVPGRYRLAVALHADGRSADYLPAAVVFEVASSRFYATGRTPKTEAIRFMVDHDWSHEPVTDDGHEMPVVATQEGV